ncbi:MAG TPA: hypothetical protein VGW12_14860 [Pyrinomonadaceae bacterium]|nr:hypothetical protein [Pyrinomonadaceae bacterium]
MIDKATGDLVLDASVRIGRWLTRREFLSSPLCRQAGSLIHNEGWHSYGLEAAGINQQRLFITLQFFGSTLKWIDFVVDAGGDVDESEQKRLHDALLVEWLGAAPPYVYEWGEVSSSYDPRSDTSSIFVGYKDDGRSLLGRLFGWFGLTSKR